MPTVTNVKVDIKFVASPSFREALFPYEETSDSEKRTHIINPLANRHIGTPGMSAQDVVDTARMMGVEVEALCGYRFIPKHNPEKFDACQACVTVAGALMRGNSE